VMPTLQDAIARYADMARDMFRGDMAQSRANI
jgi:hypothetical protein